MGTNWYRIKEVTPIEHDQLHAKLDEFIADKIDSWDMEQVLREFDKSHRVHLCKRSCGWQILWQKHPEYEDLASIRKFLSEPGTHIEDEYGDTFTLDQFLNDELEGVRCSKYLRDDLYDHAKYAADPNQPHSIYDVNREWKSADGLRFTNDEFS